jgi:antitoxin CcdA
MMSVTVTVRIPKELKEEAERHGINISHVLRRALEEELRRRKLKKLRRLQRGLESSSPEFLRRRSLIG